MLVNCATAALSAPRHAIDAKLVRRVSFGTKAPRSRRVDLHAVAATSARGRGGADLSPLEMRQDAAARHDDELQGALVA